MIHFPSLWLGAHGALVVVCVILAPAHPWTLVSAIPSLVCLWANWRANFHRQEAQAAEEPVPYYPGMWRDLAMQRLEETRNRPAEEMAKERPVLRALMKKVRVDE